MGKINYRTDDINKKLKQIDELVGSNKNLSNQINSFNSQLETIDTQKTDKNMSKIIFMPIIDTDSAGGDCSVVVTKNGKVIMIDTGASHSYSLIKQELINNNITKIDYVIISHYHVDHCQNLGSLINDFDMTTTKYYLCKHTDKFVYGETTFLSLITDKEKVYPNNGDILQVDELKFTFYNCSQEDIDYYNSLSNPNYNDYSMVCYCENEKYTVFFAGDICSTAQGRINDKGFVKKCDLLKIEHHGCDMSVNHDYVKILKPTYSIMSDSKSALGNGGIKKNIMGESMMIQRGMGAKIYCTGKETVIYSFNEHSHHIRAKYDIGVVFKDVSAYTNIYLDENYVGVSDGSYYKPFRTLREALGEAYKLAPLNILFVPKSGSFSSNEHVRIANYPSTIKLDNITMRALHVRNANLIIGTLNITGGDSRALMIESSNVEFNTITVDGNSLDADTVSNGRGVTIYKSKFYGTNLNISNKKLGLSALNLSDVFVMNLGGENNEYAVTCSGGSKLRTNKCTMTYTEKFVNLDSTSDIKGALVNDLTSYLNEGEDLNSFKSPNTRYVSKTGEISISLLNKPTNIGFSFVLEVSKQTEDGSIMQTIKSRHFSNNNGSSNLTGIWVRTFNNTDDWSDWFKII